MINEIDRLFKKPERFPFAHIWEANLSIDELSTEIYKMLSDAEKDRVQQFVFAEDKKRFTLARYFLRGVLACYSRCEPSAVKIMQDGLNKPYIADSCNPDNVYFNLSYRENYAYLIVSDCNNVGIDIEKHRHIDDIDQFARDYFSETERKFLHSLSDSQKQQYFFKFWSRKEAYIKAIGKGLSYSLTSFSCIKNKSALPFLQIPQDKTSLYWILQDLPAPDGYSAAWAIKNEERELHTEFFKYRIQ